MVYGACLSVTLPSITSGWLDAIDQKKLGELHEIFYDYDATEIDYADYADYVDYTDYANGHWKGRFTSEELSFLQLTLPVPQKGSVTEAATKKVTFHSP